MLQAKWRELNRTGVSDLELTWKCASGLNINERAEKDLLTKFGNLASGLNERVY